MSVPNSLEEVVDIPGKADEEKIGLREIERETAQTAKWLGYLIVGAFAATATVTVFVGLFASHRNLSEILELLKAIGAIFGTPLGFVLGYYYATARD